MREIMGSMIMIIGITGGEGMRMGIVIGTALRINSNTYISVKNAKAGYARIVESSNKSTQVTKSCPKSKATS